MERARTWHFGLVADWWAEFGTAEAEELEFFGRAVERFGQPVLDAGCGAGRLLVALSRGSLDIDGCDVSPDMIDRCRSAAQRAGFQPQLFVQRLDELDLPRTYRTIYMCGAFGLGMDRRQDEQALRRLRQHLAPGGGLALDLYPPYASARDWALWRAENGRSLPSPWPEAYDVRVKEDGTRYALRTRILSLDPVEQFLVREIQVERQRPAGLLEQESYTLRENMYFRNELELLLERSGYGDIETFGADGIAPPTAADTRLFLVARARRTERGLRASCSVRSETA